MLCVSFGYIGVYFKNNATFLDKACVFMYGSKVNMWYVHFLVKSGMTVFVPYVKDLGKYWKHALLNKDMYTKMTRVVSDQLTQTIDLIRSLNYKRKITLYGKDEGGIVVAGYSHFIDKKVIIGRPEYTYHATPSGHHKKNIMKISVRDAKIISDTIHVRVKGPQTCKVYILSFTQPDSQLMRDILTNVNSQM